MNERSGNLSRHTNALFDGAFDRLPPPELSVTAVAITSHLIFSAGPRSDSLLMYQRPCVPRSPNFQPAAKAKSSCVANVNLWASPSGEGEDTCSALSRGLEGVATVIGVYSFSPAIHGEASLLLVAILSIVEKSGLATAILST